MDKLEQLIVNIINYENNSALEEVKVDLKRITEKNFGNDIEDNKYIDYLFKHYNNEINYINSIQVLIFNNNIIISRVINLRNYLIKIAILRICYQKRIEYEITRLNDTDYCLNLINT